ncbi:hypothetical protein PHYBOEH_011318 [Phytophthora boehmeriae]|uniref:tRNA (guanine(9)-N(1))-methyltransferase n=1 Tax=Phytophthora boehmeriae TaxID=109152 RepID=A0A8T1X2R8_9STRA|nr:hypothetical protein PHYBOEH_011318 [Phytophthora boehmeriae]
MESPETLRDRDARVPDVDPAADTSPSSLPGTSQLPRKTSALRAKRPARERQKKERFDLLHSMTADERRKFLQDEEKAKEETLLKLQRAVAADSTNQRIAIDLGFDSIMNDKELRSLANQLRLSYGAVKQMPEPFQLLFCNPSKELTTSLGRFGAPHWYVQWRHGGGSVAEHFAPSNLVYLSPDSPNVLKKMDPTKIYVIGGIVDKSRKKGATMNAATAAGISTVRLPIQEHFPERLDHILNVNTVIDVLINFQALGDWPRALDIAIPQRKRSQLGRKALRRRKKQQQITEETTESNDAFTTSRAIKTYTPVISCKVGKTTEEASPTEDLRLWM